MAGPVPGLKALPLSRTANDKPVDATRATIANGSYPLARTVYLYANRGPKTTLSPDVSAFLHYVVSAEGQAVVSAVGGYLPLPDAMLKSSEEALR